MVAGLTRLVVMLLGRAVVLLPVQRRGWGEWLLTELRAPPPGRHQLDSLISGLWLVLRAAPLARMIGYLLASVSALAVVLVIWVVEVRAAAVTATIGAGVMAVRWLRAAPLRRGVPVAARRSARLVRAGCLAGLTVCLLLVIYGWVRYPALADEVGTPAFLSLLLVLQTAPAATVCLRYGTVLGPAAGGLIIIGRPFDQSWHLPNSVLAVAYRALLVAVVLGAPAAAAALTAHRTGRFEDGLTTGGWAGLTGAVVYFILGVAMDLLFPAKIPIGPSALAHHSANLLAAHFGEELAGYITIPLS